MLSDSTESIVEFISRHNLIESALSALNKAVGGWREFDPGHYDRVFGSKNIEDFNALYRRFLFECRHGLNVSKGI